MQKEEGKKQGNWAALSSLGITRFESDQIGDRTMRFTEQQIEQFQTEGWLAVPNFWSENEVTAMRLELDRLKETGKLRNVATDGDGKTHSTTVANLQLCPMWPHSPLFQAMPFAPGIAEALEQLIGGPVLLHLDQVFLKPAGNGVGTNWHQDNAYFQIEDPLKGTALWTAVHAATGPFVLFPASFGRSCTMSETHRATIISGAGRQKKIERSPWSCRREAWSSLPMARHTPLALTSLTASAPV